MSKKKRPTNDELDDALRRIGLEPARMSAVERKRQREAIAHTSLVSGVDLGKDARVVAALVDLQRYATDPQRQRWLSVAMANAEAAHRLGIDLDEASDDDLAKVRSSVARSRHRPKETAAARLLVAIIKKCDGDVAVLDSSEALIEAAKRGGFDTSSVSYKGRKYGGAIVFEGERVTIEKLWQAAVQLREAIVSASPP